jgi:hypothetical protein
VEVETAEGFSLNQGWRIFLEARAQIVDNFRLPMGILSSKLESWSIESSLLHREKNVTESILRERV